MQFRSEETRKQILAAASQLFSLQGYNNTGVADICAQAGISKGAFYYHFASKQALFLELLNRWLSELYASFSRLRLEAQNVPQAIRAMAQIAGQALQSSDHDRSIILEFWMQAYRDPEIWQATIAPYQRYIEYFTELFKQGIAEGTLNDINPSAAAHALVALGMGLLLQALIQPQQQEWHPIVEQAVEILLEGMTRRAG